MTSRQGGKKLTIYIRYFNYALKKDLYIDQKRGRIVMAKQQKKSITKQRRRYIDPRFIRLKKWISSLFILLFYISFIPKGFADTELLWNNSGNGIDENIITAVCAIKGNPNMVFAGAERSIYKSTDSGANWTRVLMLKGERKGIKSISFDVKDLSNIYAATSDGLYISQDEGETWHRVFKGMNDSQRDVSCIGISQDSDVILIGTKRGLFISRDKAKSWSAEKTFINKQIRSIAVGENCFYVCATDGVYYTKKDHISWDRIYVAKAYDEIVSDQYSDNADNKEEHSELNYLVIDDKKAYLATNYGLYTSLLGVRDWQMVTCEGLLTRQVEFILVISKRIFVITGKGIFEYNSKSSIWKSCSAGLTTLKVNTIDAAYAQGIICAATDRGLFRAELDKMPIGVIKDSRKENSTIYNKEPGILEIQQVAINYAEVSPDKIRWMRRSAQHKALLPKVSLGFDRDIDRTIDLDRGGTNDPDFYIEGPRERSFGWGVDLSWDLGELIWNDDQTNIDVRSRLMVQLRNDVLDEVTKLYFERKRLQAELLQNPVENSSKRALKQLRFDELTANIDGLTGGYMSENLQ